MSKWKAEEHGMSWQEYEQKEQDYIEFARSSDPEITDVSDARRILGSAARAIQRMNHTFSGCDWCDGCGGGMIALCEAQQEAKSAIEYILAAGETFDLVCACHHCWHYDATHVRTENRQFGWSEPVCDKCSVLDEFKAWKREDIEEDLDCGIWHMYEVRTSSCTS
jgi:hypothetical protein